jgi:hypothetical protein
MRSMLGAFVWRRTGPDPGGLATLGASPPPVFVLSIAVADGLLTFLAVAGGLLNSRAYGS